MVAPKARDTEINVVESKTLEVKEAEKFVENANESSAHCVAR